MKFARVSTIDTHINYQLFHVGCDKKNLAEAKKIGVVGGHALQKQFSRLARGPPTSEEHRLVSEKLIKEQRSP